MTDTTSLENGREATLMGEYVDCYSRERSSRECSLRLLQDAEGRWNVHVARGGVTGSESFSIDSRGDWRRLREHGWNACMGRPNEYDKLSFSGPEMARALSALGIE